MHNLTNTAATDNNGEQAATPAATGNHKRVAMAARREQRVINVDVLDMALTAIVGVGERRGELSDIVRDGITALQGMWASRLLDDAGRDCTIWHMAWLRYADGDTIYTHDGTVQIAGHCDVNRPPTGRDDEAMAALASNGQIVDFYTWLATRKQATAGDDDGIHKAWPPYAAQWARDAGHSDGELATALASRWQMIRAGEYGEPATPLLTLALQAAATHLQATGASVDEQHTIALTAMIVGLQASGKDMASIIATLIAALQRAEAVQHSRAGGGDE